jgi:hypothetical protein
MLDLTNFYSLTVTIAIIILILALAFVGWTMSKSKDIVKFPQLQNTCPDNWTINVSGHCVQPEVGNINYGNTSATPMNADNTPGLSTDKKSFDPNDAGWSASGNAACAKKKWASNLGISWDTITNANYC